MRTVLALAALLPLAAACSSSGDDPVSATTPTTTVGATLPALEISAEHESTASVVVAEQSWEFEVSCAQPSEGDILVWGSGDDPEQGRPSELLLEASASSPYIGITAGGQLIEAAIESPLVLAVDAGVITGDGIEFVADADIETGVGTPLGDGSVRVECSSYQEPPIIPN